MRTLLYDIHSLKSEPILIRLGLVCYDQLISTTAMLYLRCFIENWALFYSQMNNCLAAVNDAIRAHINFNNINILILFNVLVWPYFLLSHITSCRNKASWAGQVLISLSILSRFRVHLPAYTQLSKSTQWNW